MFARLRRLFSIPRKRPQADQQLRPEKLDAVEQELLVLTARLRRFLAPLESPQGEIRKEKSWSLSKSRDGLFRLEAEGLSLLIHTGSFVEPKGKGLSGLLVMDEVELCRALSGARGIDDFLRRAEPIRRGEELLADYLLSHGNDAPLASTNESRTADPLERLRDPFYATELPLVEALGGYDNFALSQVITAIGPNGVAHLLLHTSAVLREKILANLSTRYLDLLLLELQSLGSGGGNRELNPHGKNLSLLEYRTAIARVRDVMAHFEAKERYLKEQEKRRKRLPQELPLEESARDGNERKPTALPTAKRGRRRPAAES